MYSTFRIELTSRYKAEHDHPSERSATGLRFFAPVPGSRGIELVEGQSLAKRIAASGRIAVDEALEIARRIALALGAAHAPPLAASTTMGSTRNV